jgi:hypothetical protein
MKAFPSQYNNMTGQTEYGMDLRDWFAGMAIANSHSSDAEVAAMLAYKVADAMLKRREIKTDE